MSAEAKPISAELPYSGAEIEYLCRNESVQHLADLIKRRTSLYFLADESMSELALRAAEHAAGVLHWDARRVCEEVASVEREFAADCAAFAATRELADAPATALCGV